QSKVDAADSIRLLDRAQLSELEPDLSQHTKGFYLPEEGQVNAQAFMGASSEYLLAHPLVTWHAETPVISVDSGRIETDQGLYGFDWVFDARGLGAREDISDLRGVRGEVFWLDAPEVHLTRPVRLMHPRYRIYIVPRPDHRYVVGATEIESEDKSPMSVRSSLELLSAVYSVHSGFAEARIVKTMTNCRPALQDNLPRIEQMAQMTRINGLYRHGYLLSPAMVERALNFGLYAMPVHTA
ncbi:MAG: FAD-dependent oxidoreductase, partial [Hydrogenovibrio sp.]|nr:FAD-dependent oxidoreductase [Hydrogenovibrio sp.]